MNKPHSKIIVALDGMDFQAAIKLARTLSGKVWGFKVNDALADSGKRIIEALKEHGNVFADPKSYDIPNTVINTVGLYAAAGADLITVHASGGRTMLKDAVSAAHAKNNHCGILSVTLLTSMPTEEALAIYKVSPRKSNIDPGLIGDAARLDIVLNLAKISAEAGVLGIVCSAKEAKAVKELTRLAIVLPGFRPPGATVNDQLHTATYEDTINADLIVVGRPITQAQNPIVEAMRINECISNEVGDE